METSHQNNLSPEELRLRFEIIQFKAREKQIEDLWRQFTEAKFKLLIIKGWAAARQFYPEPFQREFVDIDIIVEPENFERAALFSKSIKTNLPIDLHKGPRHLDSLNFEQLYSAAVSIECGSANIKIPCAEDHLRILCNHWLTDGGANRGKLWDVYYAVANRSTDFDWERFLNIVSNKRRRWLECAIGLAHCYLDLDISDTPISDAGEKLPAWFVKAVEKEWNSRVVLQPLNFYLNDRKLFWGQVKKRLPPNPIQATVLEEGDFDRYPRIWYQIKNIFSRMIPSLKRMNETLKHNKD